DFDQLALDKIHQPHGNASSLNGILHVRSRQRPRFIVVTDWLTRPEPVGDTVWSFPPASEWPDDDLVATGGDLDPATVIHAYRRGLFPMGLHARARVLGWWSPSPRGILPLGGLRVTRSMRQSARRYDVRVDTCFADVIRGCANPARKGVWITGRFIEAYTALH